MNKIILLSDTEKLPQGAFDFARILHEQQPILLTGVFIPRQEYWNTLLYYSYGIDTPLYLYPMEDEQPEITNAALTNFKNNCERLGIEYRLHESDTLSTKENLQKESRFADLLVMSSHLFYESQKDEITSETGGNTLHYAECPVIVVPEQMRMPNRLILAYDGSASSVFAIRQFAHIMPEFTNLETLLVYASSNPATPIPNAALIEELASRHYPNLTIMKLNIDPDKAFSDWLGEHGDSLLITGAQGRSGFSEFFKKSFVGTILQRHQMPVFVAHR